MLTANYYAILSNLACAGGAKLTNSNIREINGTVRAFYDITTTNPSNVPGNLFAYNHALLLPTKMEIGMNNDCLVFGTSREPETFNDYKVTSLLQAMTFSIGGITANYDESNKKYTITRRYIINNTSGSTQTITEYGIFGTYQCGMSQSTACLIYRELLDEPFTIEVNETVNFDLTLTYDLPAEYVPNE